MCGVCQAADAKSMLGDVDFNGKIDLYDVKAVLKSVLNIEPMSAASYSMADVNGDGNVDLTDAHTILKAAIGVNITQDEGYEATDTQSNISYNSYKIRNGVLCILKNNNSYPLNVEGQAVYYRAGAMIGTNSDYNYCLEPGREAVMFFLAPYDSDYNYMDYDSYRINFKANVGTNLVYGASSISVKSNWGTDNVTAEFKNESSTDFKHINATAVFYDIMGNVVGYDNSYVDCEKGGSIDYVSFDFPYDDEFNTIIPASYKIYVNSTYIYTWMQ